MASTPTEQKQTTENPKMWLADIKEYLLAHESDIACCRNDFGSLNWVFNEIFLRQPRSK